MKGRRSRSVCDALFSPSRSVLARADKVIPAARGKADSLCSMGIFPSLTLSRLSEGLLGHPTGYLLRRKITPSINL